MGISGLLPFLKKSSRSSHVREFKSCTVAVDAYCWLHKGAFSCADKLVKGEKTDGYVVYCMKMVNMLLSHQLKPILVFDGQHLPSKLVTEVKRRESREKYKIQAREFLRQGNNAKARECFQRCVEVTSDMALQLIKACRAKNVDCIVAPYEADAQLAFLSLKNIAHIIITEDSDLLAFGCHRVFFKMDATGAGVLIEKENLYLSLGGNADMFNRDKFRRMCILSGCDYLPSLPGIGLGKAFKFFSRTSDGEINSTLCRVPTFLNMPQLEMTSEYRENFIKADNTFLYQLVYDPLQRKLVPLTPYPDDLNHAQMPYAGKFLDDTTAFQLAIGNLDVGTLQQIDVYDPDAPQARLKGHSIWSTCPTTRSLLETNEKTHGKREEADKRLLTRQINTKVEFTLKPNPQTSTTKISIMSDTELTNQYFKMEGSSSPILGGRKRRRTDLEESSRDCLPSQELVSSQSTDSGLGSSGSFASSHVDREDDKEARTTPERKRPNIFKKDISNSSAPSSSCQFSALDAFSQMRKRTIDGEEIVISSYFDSTELQIVPDEPSNVTETLNSDLVFDHCIKSGQSSSTMSSAVKGCRPSGLARPLMTPKSKLRSKVTKATTIHPSGLRQLNLRDMFTYKP